MRKYHHCYKLPFLLLLLSLTSIFSSFSLAKAIEQDKNLWIEWEVHDPTSDKQLSHAEWQAFIDKYVSQPVDGLSLIKYARVTPQDHTKLNQYIRQLSKTNIGSFNRNEQLAFWINLYNALIVKIILEHYPVDSIQQINISPGLFSAGPWDANLVKIKDFNISLSDIRNRIIRPIWNDPRTLYTLCNGAIGSPNIPATAMTGQTINQQLNTAAKNYINSLRGVQITQNKLIVSQLFEWYEEDFGGNKQDVINHIKLYAAPKLHQQLGTFKTINSYFYNWHINSKIIDDD
jgi:hypothetical protein